jgi:hypothetical protein
VARLFLTHNGTKYEKKFRANGAPFYVDQRGQVLDESLARRPGRAPQKRTLNLSESDPERSRQIDREARDRRRQAAELSESTRQKKRVELLKGAGMTQKEAEIAARGRGACSPLSV